MKRFLSLVSGLTLAASLIGGCNNTKGVVTLPDLTMTGACGATGGACCSGNVCNDPTATCTNGVCVGTTGDMACTPGGAGTTCCNNACAMGFACMNGTCVASGAPTGAPCTKAGDCANGVLSTQKGQCLKTTGMAPNQLTWPLGYCTSACRQGKTDPSSGTNSDCPGGNGTCETGSNLCVSQCQSSMDCRAQGDGGYSCFVVQTVSAMNPLGCQPTALSQCDPQKAGDCPNSTDCISLDGGTGDAGMMCFHDTCVNVGDGTVGSCVGGCDPFHNLGCVTDPMAPDCHASDVTGEGLCTGAAAAGKMAGSSCGNFFSDCPGGYGCLSGKCWKYCNDANKGTQCSAGATCQKFSMNTPVPTSVAGICSMSP